MQSHCNLLRFSRLVSLFIVLAYFLYLERCAVFSKTTLHHAPDGLMRSVVRYFLLSSSLIFSPLIVATSALLTTMMKMCPMIVRRENMARRAATNMRSSHAVHLDGVAATGYSSATFRIFESIPSPQTSHYPQYSYTRCS